MPFNKIHFCETRKFYYKTNKSQSDLIPNCRFRRKKNMKVIIKKQGILCEKVYTLLFISNGTYKPKSDKKM